MSDQLPPLPEPFLRHWLRFPSKDVGLHTDDAMRAYALAAVTAERSRIAASLRRSGATLPAPEAKGTPESGITTGLCIALTLVDDSPA